MAVAKVTALGILIACWSGASALGGPMLVLGTFSTQPSTGPAFAPSPRVAPPSTASFAPPSGPTPLRLGVSSQGAGPFASPAPAYVPPAPVQESPAPAPVPIFRAPPAPAPPPTAPAVADAFINLGGGPYPGAGTLTTGNALPWYLSRPVANLYGGTPTPQQQAEFNAAIVQRVDRTFRLSGIPVSLTANPNAPAAHTLSVVSGAVNPSAPQVIGMTYVGGDGFHYIDQAAKAARSVDQLQWIVAHNVAHELMLAFGVPEVHDQSGRFIDSTTGNWLMMTDPDARFSPEAAADLLSRDFQGQNSTPLLMGAQLLDTEPVPEPTTLALWGAGALALWAGRKARARGRGFGPGNG